MHAVRAGKRILSCTHQHAAFWQWDSASHLTSLNPDPSRTKPEFCGKTPGKLVQSRQEMSKHHVQADPIAPNASASEEPTCERGFRKGRFNTSPSAKGLLTQHVEAAVQSMLT